MSALSNWRGLQVIDHGSGESEMKNGTFADTHKGKNWN